MRNAIGCSAEATATVVVHRVRVDAGLDQEICLDESAQIGTTREGRRQYVWSPATDLDDPSYARLAGGAR